jgi:hypothetical protein
MDYSLYTILFFMQPLAISHVMRARIMLRKEMILTVRRHMHLCSADLHSLWGSSPQDQEACHRECHLNRWYVTGDHHLHDQDRRRVGVAEHIHYSHGSHRLQPASHQ